MSKFGSRQLHHHNVQGRSLKSVALGIKWPLGHFMLDFPIGQFLLYCAFVIAKSPRATARGLFFG